MAFPNAHKLHPRTKYLLSVYAAHLGLTMKANSVSGYALSNLLKAKGHNCCRQTIYKILKCKYMPHYDLWQILYSEFGLVFPDDVVTFKPVKKPRKKKGK